MDNNWYSSKAEQGENWYAPFSNDENAAEDASRAARSRKKRRGLIIVLCCVAFIALIAGSSILFREKAAPAGINGFDSVDPGFSKPDNKKDSDSSQSFDDFQDYFKNYYTSGYTQAEECRIPKAETNGQIKTVLQEASGEELKLQEIYDRCAPAIVAISAYPDEESKDSYYWGTGVIMNEDGYIVTNSHIVEGTCRATVTLNDDREFEARLVGNDSRSDIAILKIEAEDLICAEFGYSDSLIVGDEVVAIGNPLGATFRSTMTNGIVSGIDRDISYNGTTLTLIQTNAALNEGNSGGALINMFGQVVGITNMKMSSSYYGSVTIEGVGFAIPSVTMKEIADSILENGKVTGRPALGITVGAVPDEAKALYELPGGLYVNAVSENSDCAAKGIRVGDIITHVNGNEARTTKDVTSLISELSVGDTMVFTIFRDGESFEITVALVDSNLVY